MAENTALIEVRQIPIIVENLRAAKDHVEAITREAASLVCTAETVQACKDKRAEIRKQFDALETERKAVKAKVMGPYEDFLKVYKECIQGPFEMADNTLKAQITAFESELKKATEDRLRAYHAEACAAHGIDWLTFNQAMTASGLKVGMADTQTRNPKRLMDALGAFIADLACGMDTIAKLPDADEIMAEFKKTLNASQAIGIVADRKKAIEAEKAEAERRAEEAKRREEAMAQAQRIAGPEMVSAPVKVPAETDEKIYTIKFTIKTTKAKALALRDFMRKEGIQYE